MSDKLVRIKNRYDTASNWASNNPVLAAGEIGIDSTNNIMKVGNGSDSWNKLDYINSNVYDDLSDETYLYASKLETYTKIQLDSYDNSTYVVAKKPILINNNYLTISSYDVDIYINNVGLNWDIENNNIYLQIIAKDMDTKHLNYFAITPNIDCFDFYIKESKTDKEIKIILDNFETDTNSPIVSRYIEPFNELINTLNILAHVDTDVSDISDLDNDEAHIYTLVVYPKKGYESYEPKFKVMSYIRCNDNILSKGLNLLSVIDHKLNITRFNKYHNVMTKNNFNESDIDADENSLVIVADLYKYPKYKIDIPGYYTILLDTESMTNDTNFSLHSLTDANDDTSYSLKYSPTESTLTLMCTDNFTLSDFFGSSGERFIAITEI